METNKRGSDPLQETLDSGGDETLLGGLDRYIKNDHKPNEIGTDVISSWQSGFEETD